MSDSIPEAKPGNSAPGAQRKSAPASVGSRPGRLPVWWLASIMFHGLLLGWLIFLSPVRVIDLNAKHAHVAISPARAQKILEQVRDRQVAPLSEQLQNLQRIHRELADLEKSKREEFLGYARELGKDAPVKVAEALQAALAAQTNALAELAQGVTNASFFVRSRANSHFDDLEAAQKAARDAQIQVSQAQERATAALSLSDDRFTQLLDSQRQAADLQEQAAKALEAADTARDLARNSHRSQTTALQREINHYTYVLRQAERELVVIPTNLVTLSNRVVQAESDLAAIKSAAVNASGESTNFTQANATPTTAQFLLSLDKPTTASSYQPGNVAAKGNDDNLLTRWTASSGSFPQWWQVDLGSVQSLSQVLIVWESASSQYQYSITVSSDNTNYATVVNATTNTTIGYSMDNFAATGRYVRVTVTGASPGQWASINECQVFGGSAPATPAGLSATEGEASAKLQQQDSPQAWLRAYAANQQVKVRQNALTSAQRDLSAALKDLASAPQRVSEFTEKVKQLMAQPDPELIGPTPEDSRLVELQGHAQQAQREAQQAQARVQQAAASVRGTPATTNTGLAALSELDKAAASLPPVSAQLQETNLAGIYDAAVQLEAASTESYRRFRATELAMVRRIPISSALQITEVAKVLRPDLRAALQTKVDSGEEVPAARQAIETARAELSAMLQLGNSLVAQARGLDRSQGSSVTSDNLQERMAQWDRTAALAAEDSQAWAKDLSGAMNPGDGGFGEGGPGQGGPGQGGPGQVGFGQGGVGGGGSGGGPGSSGWFPGGPGSGAGRFTPDTRRLPSWPGRRIAAAGPSTDWVFVDSWYLLGPFDNSRRANIDTKFPPETIIDLNGVYHGKNNVPIRWEFYQAAKPSITPPLTGYNAAYNRDPQLSPEDNYHRNLQYIIYYAYSELWFQKDCDLWVAIGSDDFSKVWVEDQLIWSSGKDLKAWRVDEGYRKVHFKQGINRILCRVENANDKTEFSFVVCLRPPQQRTAAQ